MRQNVAAAPQRRSDRFLRSRAVEHEIRDRSRCDQRDRSPEAGQVPTKTLPHRMKNISPVSQKERESHKFWGRKGKLERGVRPLMDQHLGFMPTSS